MGTKSGGSKKKDFGFFFGEAQKLGRNEPDSAWFR